MADRAEMFSLSTFHSLSPPGCRAPQDISLEEFDDEDLSEITDDCGLGLNYDSDHYEKDCLVLERREEPQTICSFQDDFQEFEMIDDNEEEEEEEEEGTGLEEGPPSPSLSPIPSPTPGETQKHRPTTLHLTAPGTQDSLNNNSSCNPAPAHQRATWQETLHRASPSLSSSAAHAGGSSPSHPCLQDGPCSDTRSSEGPPDPARPPCKPRLRDAEGASRHLPGEEDYNKNLVPPARGPQAPLPRESPPPAEEKAGAPQEAPASPARETPEPLSSEGEGPRRGGRARGGRGLPSASSDTTSPSSDPGIEADLRSRSGKAFLPGGRRSQELSSPGSDSDVEGELEAAFSCGGSRLAAGGNMISSISETELDLSSGSSSSGRSSHLTNSIEEASSPGSEADLEADLEGPGPGAPPRGLKDALLLDAAAAKERLLPLRLEELDKEDPPGSLELESLRRSFYLPVGPKLLPEGADDQDDGEEEEGRSEYDSESDSESEADLSEDSDSPWLLSNLVNKMISEGSYPIKCAEDCFPAAHSLADTISPASDLEAELLPGEPLGEAPLRPPQSIELVDMETLRCALQSAAREPPDPGPPCLWLSNPTEDTIAPLCPGRPLAGCCKAPPPRPQDWAPQGQPGPPAQKDRIDDVRLEPPDDVSTAQTNLGFRLEDGRSRQASPSPEELPSPLPRPAPAAPLDESLAYDAVKYTLVVDENTQLELVSLKRCTSLLSSDGDDEDDSEGLRACQGAALASDSEDGLVAPGGRSCSSSSSEDSSPEADLHFSKKFLNVFVNSTSRSSSTESFGLFSCMVNGEEREQTHRAVFRFIPRHEDELELDVDDPILVELEEDDYWYWGYNMRTGERGIFPAFYAHEVVSQAKEVAGLKRNPCWMERFNVQFLGSVEVPYHQGNSILCAAMQKIATTRKLTVHLRPPATCDLEISLQGVKLILSVNEYSRDEEFERCSHFFQMKNISFCGCHPRNSCYFGFITKHPVLSRFACHVFVSQESMRPVAECVGRAFQEYYQEHLEFACPTEDIYLE